MEFIGASITCSTANPGATGSAATSRATSISGATSAASGSGMCAILSLRVWIHWPPARSCPIMIRSVRSSIRGTPHQKAETWSLSFARSTKRRRIDWRRRTARLHHQHALREEGFFKDGNLNARFKLLIERLPRKNGWFVPVHTLLEFLRERNGGHTITPSGKRRALERRWLFHKFRVGTT